MPPYGHHHDLVAQSRTNAVEQEGFKGLTGFHEFCLV